MNPIWQNFTEPTSYSPLQQQKNPSPNRIHKPLLNLSRPFTKNKTLHIETEALTSQVKTRVIRVLEKWFKQWFCNQQAYAALQYISTCKYYQIMQLQSNTQISSSQTAILSPAVSKTRNVKVQDGLEVLLILLVAANRDTDKWQETALDA